MTDEGWVKLHRKFLNWGWHDIPEMVSLFIHILLEANHDDMTWRGITVSRGQLITSRDKLSTLTGISTKTVRTCLSRLEKTGEIIKKRANGFTIITICNYWSYQAKEECSGPAMGQQGASKGPTMGQRWATNKNDKNERIKEDIYIFSSSSSLRSDSEECPTESSDAQIPDENDEKILPNRHCENVVDFWNKTVVETKAGLPIVKTLTEKRKKKMRIRWKEFSEVGDPVEVCRTIFQKICASKFCQGDNARGWSADFDWVFRNEENWAKIYEGNFDDRPNARTTPERLKTASRVEQAIETFNEVENWIHGRNSITPADSTPDFQLQP